MTRKTRAISDELQQKTAALEKARHLAGRLSIEVGSLQALNLNLPPIAAELKATETELAAKQQEVATLQSEVADLARRLLEEKRRPLSAEERLAELELDEEEARVELGKLFAEKDMLLLRGASDDTLDDLERRITAGRRKLERAEVRAAAQRGSMPETKGQTRRGAAHASA